MLKGEKKIRRFVKKLEATERGKEKAPSGAAPILHMTPSAQAKRRGG